jgi:hypothetical protein
MTRRVNWVCLMALAASMAALMPAATQAEHTRYWRQTDFSDFDKGNAQGVAVRSDGKLTLAPRFESFADPNLAHVWALRLDSRGRLYAAGGSDAKVLRFDASGKATTVFQSSELAAQTIAFDAKDNLYVGTSPDGKVYKVAPDGQQSVFFEPKTKYIWALAVDSQGVLFVATGDKGEIFAVTPEGKGQLFYQSQQRHARSLAFDAAGRLLIGTDPDGLILRVDVVRKDAKAFPMAGAPFAVYETAKAEVTSLVEGPGGILYAASIGDKARTPPSSRISISGPAPQAPAAAISSQSIVISQAPLQPQPGMAAAFPAFSVAGGAEVVKIAPDGSPEVLWTSRDDLVFAAGLSPAGKLLLGTGNNGSLVELEGDAVFARIAKTASAEVMSLATAPDGRIFVATANPGKIFVLGPGYESSGSFESEPFDAKIFSQWGRLTWWGENASAQGQLAFYVRSGNTANTQEDWSAWAGPYKTSGEVPAGCPPARFVQWKAVFTGASQGSPPSVSWVSLPYLPKNVAPVVDDIAVQDPGIRVAGFSAAPDGPANAAAVPLRYPRPSGAGPSFASVGAESSARGSRTEAPPQGFEQKGYQSVLWSAHDDNGDDLVFTIYYRGEGEQNWRLLKDKLTQRHYSWDTAALPDGAYYLKIVASDSPSNPADQSLRSQRESDRLEIANTPPRIEKLRAAVSPGGAKASFDAISTSGAVADAQYSLDAGEWNTVFPSGQLSDAPSESYAIDLPGLAAGEHTLAVQITDRFDNTAAAKVTFLVPAQAHQ